jgi:hypothetical protein
LKEQEAAVFDPDNYGDCENCNLDFWGIAPNGMAGGWACASSFPNSFLPVRIDKWNGSTYQEIGRGTADVYNGNLSSVCGGSPYHQFNIYVGSNGGPGKYRVVTYLGRLVRVRAFYR